MVKLMHIIIYATHLFYTGNINGTDIPTVVHRVLSV